MIDEKNMNPNGFPKLNLNEREKERFSNDFKRLAEACNKLSYVIEIGNDEEINKQFFFYILASLGVKSFEKIIISNTDNHLNAKPLSPNDEFPDFIKNPFERP